MCHTRVNFKALMMKKTNMGPAFRKKPLSLVGKIDVKQLNEQLILIVVVRSPPKEKYWHY